MPTNFPAALDALVNPTATDDQSDVGAGVGHAEQHSDINDAMEAVQAKLGIDGSADTTSVDYKLANGLSYFRRDTITAGAGDDTISLNKMPQAGSLFLAMDKVPLEDSEFTLVSRAITLATPSAGGEKFIVQYATNEPAPGPSVFVTTLSISGTYPDAKQGVAYSEDLTIAGGDGVYVLTGGTGIISGSLPAGLSLSIAGAGPYTLRLSGTPTTPGASSFTVGVDSGDGQSDTSAQSLDTLAVATWNPADKSSDVSLSGGNLTASTAVNASPRSARATLPITANVYWETVSNFTPPGGGGNDAFMEPGIANATQSLTSYLGDGSTNGAGGGFSFTGGYWYNNSAVGNFGIGDLPTGTRIGHAYNPSTGTYRVTIDGSTWHTVVTGLTGTWYPACSLGHVSQTLVANFGQSAMTWAPPSGHTAGVYG